MIRKILFAAIAIGLLYQFYGDVRLSCRTLSCKKTEHEWFRKKYDSTIPVLLDQKGAQPYLARILDPNQREFVYRMIAELAQKHPIRPAKGKITCAVVGNSGNLIGQGQGDDIDAHRYVFRMNSAPIEGYEKDVGTKTTHHVTHSNMPIFRDYGADVQNMVVVADTGWHYAKRDGREAYASKVTMTYLLALDQAYPGIFPKTELPVEPSFTEGTHFAENFTALSGNLSLVNPDFLYYTYENWFDPQARMSGTFPSIGFKTIIIAFSLCDQITLYGFGADKNNQRWHHYFNEGSPLKGAPSKAHRWQYQEWFLQKLVDEHIVQ